MRLPFGTVLTLRSILLTVPTLALGILGAIFGTAIPVPLVGNVSGWVLGALIGLLTGMNLVALFLFLLGLFAIPYGTVI
jgi:hypothetical protein